MSRWNFGKLLAGITGVFRAAGNTITTSQDLAKAWGWLNGFASSSGVAVNVESAEGVAAVGRAVRLLCDSISVLPLNVYQRDGKRREIAHGDKLHRLLHWAPNEHQTSFQFRALMQRDLELRGNAYALIVRGVRKEPLALHRLHPDHVTPRMADDGTITYEWAGLNGKREVFRRDQIMHLWSWSDDGLVGRSPIQVHRDAIGESIAMVRHSSKLFANGARPSGIVTNDPSTSLGGDSLKALRDDFAKLYTGVENAYRVAVLPGGLSFKPVSMSMDETRFIEGRKLSTRDIARIFGVPPHKIGDLEDATFSNIEHQALEYVTDAILPRITLWEMAIQRDLLMGDESRYVKFNVSGLLRGDSKTRAEALAIWRRNGIINADEWRELEDLNPIESGGGDVYIVEKNMVPLDRIRDVADAAIEKGAPEPGSLEELRERLEEMQRTHSDASAGLEAEIRRLEAQRPAA